MRPVNQLAHKPFISSQVLREQTIVVKSLDPIIDELTLAEMFLRYGTVLSCRVMRDHGQSRGFAFVNFDSSESVVEAIKGMNKKNFMNRNLVVEKYRPLHQQVYRPAFVVNYDNKTDKPRDPRLDKPNVTYRDRSPSRESLRSSSTEIKNLKPNSGNPLKDCPNNQRPIRPRASSRGRSPSLEIAQKVLQEKSKTDIDERTKDPTPVRPPVPSPARSRCRSPSEESLRRTFKEANITQSDDRPTDPRLKSRAKESIARSVSQDSSTSSQPRECPIGSKPEDSSSSSNPKANSIGSKSDDSSRSLKPIDIASSNKPKDSSISFKFKNSSRSSKPNDYSRSNNLFKPKDIPRTKEIAKETKPSDAPVNSYPGTRLYLKNLGQYDTEDRLRQLFEHFGTITGVELPADKRADSAHVWFADHKEAENAARILSAMPVSRRQEIFIKLFPEESSIQYGVWRVFVDNLNKDIDEKIMTVKFKNYGRIMACKISMDEKDRSEGFGFVVFFDREAADKAVKDNGMKWWKNTIKIEHFNIEHRELFNCRLPKLFVKNLSEDFVTKDMLKGLFMPYGSVTEAELLKDKSDNFFGFGSITFQSTTMAHKAWKKLNGLELRSGQKMLVWKDRHCERLTDCYLCYEALEDDKTIDLGCEHQICRDCARKFFVEHVSECRTDRCKCPEPTCPVIANHQLINFFVKIYNEQGKPGDSDANKQDKKDSPVKSTSVPKDNVTINVSNTVNTAPQLVTSVPTIPATTQLNSSFDGEPELKKPKVEPDSPEIIIDKEVRKCPECHGNIESTISCDYMICNCGHQFCWSCNKTWTDGHRCTK